MFLPIESKLVPYNPYLHGQSLSRKYAVNIQCIDNYDPSTCNFDVSDTCAGYPVVVECSIGMYTCYMFVCLMDTYYLSICACIHVHVLAYMYMCMLAYIILHVDITLCTYAWSPI